MFAGDPVGGGTYVPALGKLHHESQVAVVIGAALHDPRRRLVAVHEPIEHLPEVTLVVAQFLGQRVGGALHGVMQALVVLRVRREQAVISLGLAGHLAGERVLILQDLNHFDHGERVVARLGQIGTAMLVRLQFQVTFVAHYQRRVDGIGHVHQFSTSRHQRADDACGFTEPITAGQTPVVASRDVSDLVAEHRCKLVFSLQVSDQAAMHEYVGIRQREGVHRRFIDHVEVVLTIGLRALFDQPVADFLNVGRPGFILVDVFLFQELEVHLFARTRRMEQRRERHRQRQDHPSDVPVLTTHYTTAMPSSNSVLLGLINV